MARSAAGQLSIITTRGVVAMMALALAEPSGIPQRLGMYFTSDQESETYAWLGSAPVMREFTGSREFKELKENSFRVTNRSFEGSLKISLDDIRRDKVQQVRTRVSQLAERSNSHWDELLFEMLNNGTDVKFALCYTGKALFATNHSDGKSGTFSNLLTKTDVPALTVASLSAVTALEIANGILGVVQHMKGYKDDQGQPMNDNITAIEVLIPTKYFAAGAVAAAKELIQNGSTTVQNPLKGTGLEIKITDSSRLKAGSGEAFANSIVVAITSGEAKAIILQEEVSPTVGALAEGSDFAVLNKAHLFTVDTTRAVAAGYPQKIAKATFGTA